MPDTPPTQYLRPQPEIIDLRPDDLAAEMVSFGKNVTGLKNTVFIPVHVTLHAPHIKVAIDPPTHIDPFGSTVSVAIHDSRVVAGDLPVGVRAFVAINREALLDYWEMRIDTDELRQRLTPLP